MSIAARIVKAINTCAAALLPRDCLLCRAPSGERALCVPCRDSLPRLTAERCPICALPTSESSICGACLSHPPHFDATHAVFRYEFPVDSLIQSLKYAHRLASADFLGEALAGVVTGFRPDLILPVPLSAKRLAERGFNQAIEIARPLARALELRPSLDQVHRIRDTPAQSRLAWKDRTKNIRHAFECNNDLSGKTIWLVDDVMTTGATLDELARTLKAHGALRVENCVVARALKD